MFAPNGDAVGPAGTGDTLGAEQTVPADARARRDAALVDRDAAARLRELHPIRYDEEGHHPGALVLGRAAAEDSVVATPADQQITLCTELLLIVDQLERPAVQPVVAGASDQRVRALVAADDVVAAAALDDVVALPGTDHIGARSTDDLVVAVGAVDRDGMALALRLGRCCRMCGRGRGRRCQCDCCGRGGGHGHDYSHGVSPFVLPGSLARRFAPTQRNRKIAVSHGDPQPA